jgi:membrane protease YdiL (CAAX protease family)
MFKNSGRRKWLFPVSVLLFIIGGHYFAVLVGSEKSTAWAYVLLFYGLWIILSMLLFLDLQDLRQMFRPSVKWYWNLLPLVFVIPTFFLLFLPNRSLLRFDSWLLINLVICVSGPWLEEIYWRGLFNKLYGSTSFSFFFSSLFFAASHPLIFGVNSKGDSGLPAFAGAFFVGSIWWLCYHRTRSLRGAVMTHFLMDVAGMAVYVLANKAILLPL